MEDKMYVLTINKFRDGGTLEVVASDGIYTKDGAIGSKTRGQWFYKEKYRDEDSTPIKEEDLQEKLENLTRGFVNQLLA